MKKCTQCAQVLSDETKFCFKCGGGNFEPVEEMDGSYQQPTYQQPAQQPPQQSYYAQQPAQPSYQQAPSYQQPAYQQPAYQQPAYQQQPTYNNTQPATIGNFIIFFLLMMIPIFNIVYLIIVAVGGPTRNVSLTNFARASLIWGAIVLVLYIILIVVVGASFMSIFDNLNRYSYGY